MIEKKTTVYESSVLIGAIYRDQPAEKVEEYLDELEFLTYTAGGEVKKRFVQRIDLPNPKTYLGSGKIEEIAQFVEENEIGSVILTTNSHPPSRTILKSCCAAKY